jgi:hypothetical protein
MAPFQIARPPARFGSFFITLDDRRDLLFFRAMAVAQWVTGLGLRVMQSVPLRRRTFAARPRNSGFGAARGLRFRRFLGRRAIDAPC